MSPSARFYIPGLDSLRCFAFLCVFVNHTLPTDPLFYGAHHLPGIFAAIALCGNFGVDLFFVLSGYLITELLLREREQNGEVDVRAFYVRRILRIWPLYFLALAIAAILSRVGWETVHPRQFAAFLLLAGNWACAFWGWPASFIAVLWSVSIEEQFYLLWVVVLRQFRRTGLVFIALGLVVLANGARFLALVQHRSADFQWTSTFTRLDPIACGILLALLLRGRLPDFRTSTRAALFTGGVLIWVGNGRWLLPYAEKYVLALPLASVGAVAIFLSALGPAESTGWLRGNPILLYLGQISYGLYIFHELAIELVTQHWWKSCCPTTLQFITCSALELALTIALASLSWRYFELPFLRLKNRFLRFDLAPTS